MSWQPTGGFVLVYQGGHHNVYCDGESHIWTTGGWVGLSEIAEKRRGKCDCAKYAKDPKPLPKPPEK